MKRILAVWLLFPLAGCALLREEKPRAPAPVPLQHAYQEAPPIRATTAPGAEPAPQRSDSPSTEAHASYEDEHEEPIADDFATSEAGGEGSVRPHPLDGVSAQELEERLRRDPTQIGSISLGVPSGGRLFNAVQMPADPRWELVDPAHAWGTQETVDYLSGAIAKVHEQFPGSPKLYIGHISAKDGGHLSPHLSHQAGRDVDISYFYTDERAGWYARAGAHNLDLPRTWAFVRALITETDVELILIDHALQALIRRHAIQIGEDETWVHGLFRGQGKLRPLIVHAKGHATHIHVRFYNPVAQETARRAHASLVARGLVRPPTYYVSHKVKPGETLGMLSRKYGVDVKTIKSANGLRRSLIRAGRVYRIPKSGGVRVTLARVAIPPRRLPPRSPELRPAHAAELPGARSRSGG